MSVEGSRALEFQYRKRYELHAIKSLQAVEMEIASFQYRKRYELHAIRDGDVDPHFVQRFNTASGMNCMQ